MNQHTRRTLALMLVGSLSLLGLGLLRVEQRHEIIRLGYQLSEARDELEQVRQEQNRLRLEETVLTNPGRIEKLASSLGMIRPKPDQLKVVESGRPLAALRDADDRN